MHPYSSIVPFLVFYRGGGAMNLYAQCHISHKFIAYFRSDSNIPRPSSTQANNAFRCIMSKAKLANPHYCASVFAHVRIALRGKKPPPDLKRKTMCFFQLQPWDRFDDERQPEIAIWSPKQEVLFINHRQPKSCT